VALVIVPYVLYSGIALTPDLSLNLEGRGKTTFLIVIFYRILKRMGNK
jgi:hypothetical protein